MQLLTFSVAIQLGINHWVGFHDDNTVYFALTGRWMRGITDECNATNVPCSMMQWKCLQCWWALRSWLWTEECLFEAVKMNDPQFFWLAYFHFLSYENTCEKYLEVLGLETSWVVCVTWSIYIFAELQSEYTARYYKDNELLEILSSSVKE